ncbi:hypothetical protein V8G54_016137 [Vigna mungo]|uniref:Secreted protein n=1 Tax=Vigna mungo TaxID=3915 RepID=A0AAQ3NLT4_VIGMU
MELWLWLWLLQLQPLSPSLEVALPSRTIIFTFRQHLLLVFALDSGTTLCSYRLSQGITHSLSLFLLPMLPMSNSTSTVANSSFPISERRRLKALCGGSGLRRNKPRGHAFVVGEPSFLLPQPTCASCCLARKRRSNLATFVPGAFLDKSCFRLSNSKLHRSSVSFLASFLPDNLNFQSVNVLFHSSLFG